MKRILFVFVFMAVQTYAQDQPQWMENLQTEPSIKVKNWPGDIDAGRDQQLERAIDEMLQDTQNK